ncbi:hypothetical protein CL659_01765 [bacterium]|nr:hypothetical protein [bacterium]
MKQVYNNFEQFIRTLSLFFLFLVCAFASSEDVKVVDKVVYSKEKKQEIRWDIYIDLPESWKVNANEPLDPYLIPTEFIPSEGKGVKWKDVFYPEPESIFLDWSDEELLVYEYQVVLSVKAFLESSVDHIQGKLTYQVCTDKICYPQETVEIKSNINQDKLLKEEPVAVEEEPVAVEDSEKALTSPIDNTNQNSLGFWVLLLAGLGLAFSPCVFPIMPIVVLSVADGERGLKAFFNSLPFVFGLVLTYSVCGAAFALLGKGSGAALQSSFFGWFLSVLFIVMGIFMLSGYTIPTSSKISKFTDFLRTKGKIGLGAALGIAATPCTAPVLASASATVLQTGSLLEGFKLFGTLGLGMAIPFICFSTLGAQIPKGGKWLITIKKAMGLALVAYGLFLAWSRFDSGDGSVQSGAEEKNQIYYFTAKWCIPCRAVDKNVWQDEEVIAFFENSNWEFIKVDLTEESEEEFQFRNEHNISGPPSLILMFSQDGLDDTVVHIGEFTKEEFFDLVSSF